MRYELRPREPEKYICFVGYDKRQRSFYVYVASKGKTGKRGEVIRNNHVVVWFGLKPQEITSVAEVKSLVSEYAELPADIERALSACAEENGIEHPARK